MDCILFTSFLLINSALCYGSSTGGTFMQNSMHNRVCKTPGCFKAAKFILGNIDKTVDPCDIFYQFACGKYIDEHSISDDESVISVLDETINEFDQKLKKNLENIGKNDPRAFQLLKSHYDVCLNEGKSKKMSAQKLLTILNKLNGWPVILGESWNELIFDWNNLVRQLRQMGYTNSMNAFIDFSIEVDKKNNTRYVINLNHPYLGVARRYLVEGLDEAVVQAYYRYMVNLAEILGADRPQAEKELSESLNFEIQLAKISMRDEESKNVSLLYNPMTVEELQTKYSYVDWNNYLNEFLRPRHHIQPSERVIVKDPLYFERLSELISKTSKRTLANYAIWRIVQESAPFMNEQFLNIKAEFDASITGASAQISRWSICLDHVSGNLPIAIGALYVRKVFDESVKTDVEEMVNDLRRSFAVSLEKIDWMDEKTKMAALKKLKLMHAHVAYPDELLDDDKLNGYFKNLKAFPNNYLDSYLSINLFEFDYGLQLLRRPVNKMDWVEHGSVAELNAYYSPAENSIVINAAYLPEQYFTNSRPNYMNYGMIGSIIGHELTHGFDDDGSQYDEQGNLKNWWDPATYQKYIKRTQCLIDQYNNYTVKEIGLHANGVNTLGENIADNGGIKLAYFAYEEYEKRNGSEPRLPGLPYSPRQMFWIAAADVCCKKYRPEELKDLVFTDEHSPEEFRVTGPFSNMPEFSKDFECPVGSPMNPFKKCTVW